MYLLRTHRHLGQELPIHVLYLLRNRNAFERIHPPEEGFRALLQKKYSTVQKIRYVERHERN